MFSAQLTVLAGAVATTYNDLVAAAGLLAYPAGYLLFGLLLWTLVQLSAWAAFGR